MDSQSLNERRIPDMFLGVLLAVAIFSLGCVVAVSFYHPKENESAQGIKEKSNASVSDERLANYTLALDWLNGFLVLSTCLLWWVTRKSALVAERALVDLERPYIFFSQIRTDINSYFRQALAWDPERTWPEFSLFVVNYGRTPGNIDVGAIYLDFLDTTPPEIVLESFPKGHPEREKLK